MFLVCKHCSGEIYWSESLDRWIHKASRKARCKGDLLNYTNAHPELTKREPE